MIFYLNCWILNSIHCGYVINDFYVIFFWPYFSHRLRGLARYRPILSELGWGGPCPRSWDQKAPGGSPPFLPLCPVLSSACDSPLWCPHMVNPRGAPGRQLPVWCKNHLSFVDFVRLTKSLACFTAIVMVLRWYPPLIRGCTWQVSGSWGTNLQVSCFCTTRWVSIPLASLVAQLVKNLPAMWETWVGKIPWRREWLPTPVFWPGEFHGLCSPWGHKESDTTEWLSLTHSHSYF